MTSNERHDHSIKIHKLPKDFRFEQKAKNRKTTSENENLRMDVDSVNKTKGKVVFSNSKQKTFSKYTGRKFTRNNEHKSKKNTAMDITVDELKESLPN